MQSPKSASYDVVIIGGAMMGSSVAWWLTRNPDFNGTLLVVEQDPTYAFTATSRTNSCIRQQFSNPVNVRVSQFGASFIHGFRDYMGGDPEVPKITLQSYGYLYLADHADFAATLKDNQQVQAGLGVATRHMTRDQIAANFPFFNLDDIIAGNHNPHDEGYFDGGTIFDWWRRKARQNGAEYCTNTVVGMTRDAAGQRITTVTLASGESIGCGIVVNATGPRAALTAAMAGIDIPVEPRKRYTYVFEAEEPLAQDLPLTIDPSGVHMRSDGRYYLAGGPPDDDTVPAFDDFTEDHSLWEDKFWPVIATRIPQFAAIKLRNSWVGHYEYNTLDQNAILGPHAEVANFLFINGFSGHGFQQSPAMGRGLAEMILYGGYRSLDLSDFGFARIARNTRFLEKAVI